MLLSLLYQIKLKQLKIKVMKKFIFAIYDAALVLMIPAIFIGYLYTNTTTSDNIKNADANQAKIQSVSSNQETGYKPGLIFVLKGI